MNHNAFQHGFAKQTDDPQIVAATAAKPGTVLKRAVGSSDLFTEDAQLPKSLPNIKPLRIAKPDKKKPVAGLKAKAPRLADRADIISFKKAQAKRDKALAEQDEHAEKERAKRKRKIGAAEMALEKARARHEKAMSLIESNRAKVEQRAEKESDRWDAELLKLDAAVNQARKL